MSTIRPVICVFADSATPKDPVNLETAEALGKTIGEGGYDIICGRSDGVTGAVALSAQQAGSHVTTVVLEQDTGEKQLADATVLTVKTEAERFSLLSSDKNLAGYVLLPGDAGKLIKSPLDGVTFRAALHGLMANEEHGPSAVLARADKFTNGNGDYLNHAMSADFKKEFKNGVLREWTPGQSIADVLAANDATIAAVQAAPVVGQQTADGVYVGFTDDGKQQIYAMPTDLSIIMTFNDAVKAVEKLNADKAFGHGDWQIPNFENLHILQKCQNEGDLESTFKTSSTGSWYWSSTQNEFSTRLTVRFEDDYSWWNGRDDDPANCRPIRLVPVPGCNVDIRPLSMPRFAR